MFRIVALLGFGLLIPASTVAQEARGVEIGTRAGFSMAVADGEILSVGIPGGSPNPLGFLVGGNSSLHVAFFPFSRLMVEPQANFDLISVSNGDSETLTSLSIASQFAYLFKGARSDSPYVGFATSLLYVGIGDVSEWDVAIGLTFGYRFLLGEHIVLRPEGGYRFWFDLDIEEITAVVALSVLLK